MSKRLRVREVILKDNIRLEKIGYDNKTQMALISRAFMRWANSDYKTINEAYKKPSTAKVVAFEECMRIYRRLNGKRLRFTANGCQTFSVGFYCQLLDKRHFVWITKSKIRCCELEDDIFYDCELEED